jgi:hypothetical protein
MRRTSSSDQLIRLLLARKLGESFMTRPQDRGNDIDRFRIRAFEEPSRRGRPRPRFGGVPVILHDSCKLVSLEAQ